VSVHLARRLLEHGAVAPDEVYTALLDVVTLGVPFVQAMVARGQKLGDQVERELARIRARTLTEVRVSAELADRLPVGMCERLLAVPISRLPSGEIEVAAVDPLDPCVGAEFSHQFAASLRISRTSLASLMLAIERWLDERAPESRASRTPAFGTYITRNPTGPGFHVTRNSNLPPPAEPRVIEQGNELASEPPPSHPIPLVRSLPPEKPQPPKPPRGLGGTDPGVGQAPRLSMLMDEQDEVGEPVIGLFRSKPPPPPSRPSQEIPTLIVPADPSELDRAESADEVLELLGRLAVPLARSSVVFAVRAGAYASRSSSRDLRDAIESAPMRISMSRYGIIDSAFTDGHFLGRIPDDEANEQLLGLLGEVEVYVVPIFVSGRPACALVLAELVSTFEGTRRADELSRLVGAALERIVRERKRGG
jgi:hypothetical protein